MNIFNKSLIFVAIATATSSYAVFANESNLPDMFTTPAVKADNAKRQITQAERNALDQAILDATKSNLPIGNEALKTGQLPNFDQKGRLAQISSQLEPKPTVPVPSPLPTLASTSDGLEISPYPKFADPNAQKNTADLVEPKDNFMGHMAMEIYDAKPEIILTPGSPITITLGIGQTNRIGFNFNKIDVRTSDLKAPMLMEGGYLYITPTDTEKPIGLLVAESGMPETAVNILLLPAPVPQVIANIQVVLTPKMKRDREERAKEEKLNLLKAENELKEINKALERGDSEIHKNSSPYESRIVDLLVEVAKENIPQGFSLKLYDEVPDSDRYPCDSSKLLMSHETVMQLESSQEIIDIVKVTNDINGLRSVEDEYCVTPGVYAAATYRKAHLAPGESTEVYILRDKNHMKKHLQEQSRKRPSINH